MKTSEEIRLKVNQEWPEYQKENPGSSMTEQLFKDAKTEIYKNIALLSKNLSIGGNRFELLNGLKGVIEIEQNNGDDGFEARVLKRFANKSENYSLCVDYLKVLHKFYWQNVDQGQFMAQMSSFAEDAIRAEIAQLTQTLKTEYEQGLRVALKAAKAKDSEVEDVLTEGRKQNAFDLTYGDTIVKLRSFLQTEGLTLTTQASGNLSNYLHHSKGFTDEQYAQAVQLLQDKARWVDKVSQSSSSQRISPLN